MAKKPSQFKHILLALANFANGTAFAITQIKRNGACRITELVTGTQSHSHGVANAWKSICFQADLNWRTNRTTSGEEGADQRVRVAKPKTDGVKRYAVTVPNLERTIHKVLKGGEATTTYQQLVQVHDVYQMVKEGKVDKALWHRGARVGTA